MMDETYGIHPDLLNYLQRRKDEIEQMRMQGMQRSAQDIESQRQLQQVADYSKAFAQLGTIGGKTASTEPVQQAVQGQMGLIGQQQRADAAADSMREKSTDSQGKLYAYLDQAKQKRDAAAAQEREKVEDRNTRYGLQSQQQKFEREMFDKKSQFEKDMLQQKGDQTKDIENLRLSKKPPNQKEEAADKEANYRYISLKNNADQLKKLVQAEGTMALTGTAGPQMDSKIYQMAVDFAKLVDPESVAREGEVASAQKYMLPIRQWGGAMTKNSTAESLIDSYVQDLDARLAARKAAKTGDVMAKTFPEAKPKADGISLEQKAYAGPKPIPAPEPGTVEGGYRFKGGDPKDKANWEPI